MTELKATLLLPKNVVPMKANLPQREPEILKRWAELDLYKSMQALRENAKIFCLHDGPPYANGELHMGHALNKTLKDIIVRFRTLQGYRAPYVPGWDCHGLPIEHNVTRELGEKIHSLSPVEVRRKCRAYAEKFVRIQREGFIRLGCVGQWGDPYLTLDPLFESRIIEAFGAIYREGFIYRGLKPIHWCPQCRTALAASTAEAEYADHTSQSITVAFPSADDPSLSIVIWTTTPWTLPANVAVAVRGDLEYVIARVGSRRFIVAEALLNVTASGCGWRDFEITERMAGSELEGRNFRHPFLDRTVPVILGDFVTTDTGTGCVHIAPGHGLEDYQVGLRYGLPIIAPVDERGRLTSDAGVFPGLGVFQANEPIVELLRERGALLDSAKIQHSYPHCWRCKGPVIFRATRQWFLAVDRPLGTDGPPLRELALSEADRVAWIPSWGKERFVGTVKERPDWCLSRQRSWGVPIPAYVCEECGEGVLSESSIAEAESMARAGRLDAWFEAGNAPGNCEKCGGALRRERDILDVWFDSGVSWFAADMLRGGSRKEGEPAIADLYLEGSDQHRGWFQSSLWPSLAIRRSAPYRAVLTHGFLLDGQGKAMHKSAGNAISPDEILKKYGADIIRLWAASENYRDDLPLSIPILEQVADIYRKVRNTWRFLAGNIDDLPADEPFDPEILQPIDRWIRVRLAEYLATCERAYDSYNFHEVYRAAMEITTGDLSAVYLDVIKDRLYCDGAGSDSRRAAQHTCREILEVTLKTLAPILCFTTDEVWGLSVLSRASKAPVSVHLADWPAMEHIDQTVSGKFAPCLEARDVILKAIETERARGVIKSSQMAAVTGPFEGDIELLRSICQVAEIFPGPSILVQPTTLPKCARCWRHLEVEPRAIGGGQGEPVLICRRCRDVVCSVETVAV